MYQQPFPQQPYPYQSPQQPPPKKSRRRLWLILSIVGGLLVVSCIGCALLGNLLPSTSANNPTPVAQASTSTPTPTFTVQATTAAPTATATQPVPTATHASGSTATHGTPRLGGPLSDFIGKYGQPNDHTSPPLYHFLRAANGPADGLIIDVDVVTNLVDDISWANTNSTGWTQSDAKVQCMAFGPSDAHYKQKYPLSSNSGYDLVYTSTSLAHLFQANEFTDGSGNMVAAGTFDVSYLYANDGSHIGDCEMIIGAQQTNN